jgi:hypothetical protein
MAASGTGEPPEPPDDGDVLIAAMTTPPSAGRETLIRNTIDALKTAGIWTLLDALWFMAAHDSQAAELNWKAPGSFVLSPQDSPAFTADAGWIGDGSADYISTGFVPSTHGVNYTLNSASFGFYSLTDAQSAGGVDMGARSGLNSNESRILTRSGANTLAPRINSGGGTNITVMDSSGLFTLNRSASNAYQAYRNGSEIGNGTNVSTAVPPVAFYLLATNNNGSAAGFSIRRLAMAFIGASLDATKQGDLSTIVAAYLGGL